MTAVVLLGHGSPDPRSAAGLRGLARTVARRRPGLQVEVAFLDHDDPGLTDVAREVAAVGRECAVVVPAFLSTAFHVRSDVPRAVAAAQAASGLDIRVTAPLGPDPGLFTGLSATLPGDSPVVLACAGTRDPAAQGSLQDFARDWAAQRGTPVVVAYAAMAEPDVPTAIERLRTGSAVPAVASYVLFPGVLPDRIASAATAAGVPCSPPLGSAVADLVLARVDAHRTVGTSPAAVSC